MILYHGTGYTAAKEIIRSGVIRNDAHLKWDEGSFLNLANGEKLDISTTPGYVYLTDKLSLACFYGNVKKPEEDTLKGYYIFKIEIPVEELLPDRDELRINHNFEKEDISVGESLEISRCVTVDHSLSNEGYNIEYVHIAINDYDVNYFIRNELSSGRTMMTPDPEDIIAKFNDYVVWKKL